MARIHFAWELGNGLGHVSRLKPLAVALAARGHEVSMGLRDLVATRSVWRTLGLPCVQAPVFLHQTQGLPKRSSSLAEIALGVGYLDGDVLAALVEGWRALLRRFDPAVVVADYAPTATLAARSLRIPSLSIGLGFTVPPVGRPLPAFRTGEDIVPGRLESAEARLVRSANQALRSTDAPPVKEGWEIFCGDRGLLCNWPELDVYARGALPPGEAWFGASFDPAGGAEPAWPDGPGPRVFAYLKGGHPGVPEVLRALVARGCRTICYLPDVESGKPPPVVHPSIAYSDRPANLATALAGSALCVCHAGGGTVAQSLLAGVPLLVLPMQAEQDLNARAVERLGAGLALVRGFDAPLVEATVGRLLDDAAYRDVARAFAARHRDFSHEAQTVALCDAIERAAK